VQSVHGAIHDESPWVRQGGSGPGSSPSIWFWFCLSSRTLCIHRPPESLGWGTSRCCSRRVRSSCICGDRRHSHICLPSLDRAAYGELLGKQQRCPLGRSTGESEITRGSRDARVSVRRRRVSKKMPSSI